MMTITTQKHWCKSHDAFKVTGAIDFDERGGKTKCTVFAYGENKNEAVARAIERIDTLLKYLEESKADLAGI